MQADIAALGYDAAEQGDFATLKTLQQAQADARLKDDPRAIALRGAVTGGKMSWAYDAEDALGISNNRTRARIDLHNLKAEAGSDPDTAAQNALANQFSTLRLNSLTAQSTIGENEAAVTLSQLQGASAAEVARSGNPYLSSLTAAGAAARAEAAQYRTDLNTPEGQKRSAELGARNRRTPMRAPPVLTCSRRSSLTTPSRTFFPSAWTSTRSIKAVPVSLWRA